MLRNNQRLVGDAKTSPKLDCLLGKNLAKPIFPGKPFQWHANIVLWTLFQDSIPGFDSRIPQGAPANCASYGRACKTDTSHADGSFGLLRMTPVSHQTSSSMIHTFHGLKNGIEKRISWGWKCPWMGYIWLNYRNNGIYLAELYELYELYPIIHYYIPLFTIIIPFISSWIIWIHFPRTWFHSWFLLGRGDDCESDVRKVS